MPHSLCEGVVRLARRRWKAPCGLSILHGPGLSGAIPLCCWARGESFSVIIRSSLALGTAELDVFCVEAREFAWGVVLELHFDFTPILLSESLPQRYGRNLEDSVFE